MWLKNSVFIVVCLFLAGCLYAFVVPQPTVVSTEDAASDLAKMKIQFDSTKSIVEAVNEEFSRSWKDADIEFAPPADSLTVARRMSLSLTGTIPSIEDLHFLKSLDEDKRLGWYAQRLLTDRRHSDYFAERLARAYVGTIEGPFLIYRRRRFVSWLSDQIQANVPYDELVTTLVTADGLWTDSPAVNFLTVNSDEERDGRPDPIRMAGRTTRAFLGVRLDCMQCHDDNLNGGWLQSDFHELAAFYSDPATSLAGIKDKQSDYSVKYLDDDIESTIEPSVPFLEDLDRDSTESAAIASRRSRLAQWITHPENKPFARTIVNRVWALAFGRPLVEPIDDIPLEGPYPPGLELLANDLIENDFDLRRLWFTIFQIQPFGLDSRADFEVTSDHEAHWAVFPLSRLRPEQVAGAIVQSSKLATIDAESHVLLRFVKSQSVGDFVKRYGDVGQDEFDEAGETIPQRLVMLNGKLIKEATNEDSPFNASRGIAKFAKSDEDAIKATYLAVLTRMPSESESKYFLDRLENRDHSRTKFFEDLYWTLLNSSEFSWNH